MSKVIEKLFIIACGVTIISCENPTENSDINQEPLESIHFVLDSTDLIVDTVENLIIDTLHVHNQISADLSFSILGYSTEKDSSLYEKTPDGIIMNDSIISWTPNRVQGGSYHIHISVTDTAGNADTCVWRIRVLSLMINSKGSWDPFGEIEGRCCHSALSFEDKIWLIGGVYELNDVWYSNDGKYWTCATANAEFGARHYHTSIVYNDKMWVFAGYPNKSDVWYSDSGEKWTSVTSSAPFGSRSGHTTVVFNNAIYLIGGNNNVAWYDQNVKFYNDVWYSRNGIDWELICPSAPFPGRTYHASTVFDGKIWVIGGIDGINDLNDCWSSKDGINWVKETDSAAFTPRRYHSVLSYDSALWLFSGFTMSRHETSSIWHSIDGEAWRRIDGYQTVPYSHASFVHRDTMWILGGYNSSNTTYFSVGLK